MGHSWGIALYLLQWHILLGVEVMVHFARTRNINPKSAQSFDGVELGSAAIDLRNGLDAGLLQASFWVNGLTKDKSK